MPTHVSVARAAALVACAGAATAADAIYFSAGFTSGAVLQRAPAAAAVYGFVLPQAPSRPPTVSVTLDGGDGAPVRVNATVGRFAGGGTACDARCYAAGYDCAVGLESCCSAPSCPMGCAIAAASRTVSECVVACRAAAGTCTYTIPGTATELDMCGDCLCSGGCPPFEAQCEAGCTFASDAEYALTWKALLPPQPAGGAFTVTATCTAGCYPAATPSANITGVTFGLVFYASGQSNMALGTVHSFAHDRAVDAIARGAYGNVRVYQFGGMGSQSDGVVPAWATTALTRPSWPWSNLSAAVAATGYAGFDTFSAAAVYFALELTDLLGAAAPPIGIITNAVGGTTIEAWSSREMLALCRNTTTANSAAPPTALFNGMAAPFVNTTVEGWLWYQGENNCGGDGTPGNSAEGVGYGCSVVALIRGYRALWSAVPGTTAPDAPFGVVALAAGGSEGSGRHMAGIRWSQTGNFGALPAPALPNTFLAQAFDLGDPWLAAIDGGDANHCARPDPGSGAYGPACQAPWTDPAAWDASLAPLLPLVRNDSTPEFLGSIHARIKSPVGRRLATAYVNVAGGGAGATSGPTIAGCAYTPGGATLVVTYDAGVLRGEALAVAPFNVDTATWGTAGDALTFMLCVTPGDPAACAADAALWTPAAAAAGPGPAAVTLALTPAQRAGPLVALRYAWPLTAAGDTCCPEVNVTRGLAACTPGRCPVKTAASLLPANPFYAVLAGGKSFGDEGAGADATLPALDAPALVHRMQATLAAVRLDALRTARRAVSTARRDGGGAAAAAALLAAGLVPAVVLPLLDPCAGGLLRAARPGGRLAAEDERLEALWLVANSAAWLHGPALEPLLPAGAFIAGLLRGGAATPGVPAVFSTAAAWALGNLAADGGPAAAGALLRQGALPALAAAMRARGCGAVAAWAAAALVRAAARGAGGGCGAMGCADADGCGAEPGDADSGDDGEPHTRGDVQRSPAGAGGERAQLFASILRHAAVSGLVDSATAVLVRTATVQGVSLDAATAVEAAWLLAELAAVAAAVAAAVPADARNAVQAMSVTVDDAMSPAARAAARARAAWADAAACLRALAAAPGASRASALDAAVATCLADAAAPGLRAPCLRLLGFAACGGVVVGAAGGGVDVGAATGARARELAPALSRWAERARSGVGGDGGSGGGGTANAVPQVGGGGGGGDGDDPSPEEALWLTSRLRHAAAGGAGSALALRTGAGDGGPGSVPL